MSNLGAYQWMTTFAKKVGGPINLMLLVASGGAAIYKGGEIAVKRAAKSVKEHRTKKLLTSASKGSCYVVTSAGESNEGVKFCIGDQYRVLEADGDSVLIEKIGDANNPYFVSAELLRTISDY